VKQIRIWMASTRNFLEIIQADRGANPRDPKARTVMASFRIAQAFGATRQPTPTIAWPSIFLHRLFTEWLLGIELRPRTLVGQGLSLYHGTGLVVNDHTVIGRNVKLRHGVTIGHSIEGGPCPTLEDGVDVGAGAIILGGITIGRGAKIGAGSVVTRSVPAGARVVGNPARVLGSVGE
jgi:putative colanic acid biosynthesis acetyltransferase WcaB